MFNKMDLNLSLSFLKRMALSHVISTAFQNFSSRISSGCPRASLLGTLPLVVAFSFLSHFLLVSESASGTSKLRHYISLLIPCFSLDLFQAQPLIVFWKRRMEGKSLEIFCTPKYQIYTFFLHTGFLIQIHAKNDKYFSNYNEESYKDIIVSKVLLFSQMHVYSIVFPSSRVTHEKFNVTIIFDLLNIIFSSKDFRNVSLTGFPALNNHVPWWCLNNISSFTDLFQELF